MADNFGQLQNGRASNGGRFYAVPSVPVAANQIFMPSPATTPLFGVAEYAVAANSLGSFASEGVFVFDKPTGWIDEVGKKIYYRPTASNSGAFVLQEAKGDVLVGFQVLANVPTNKLGVLLTSPEFVVNKILVTSTADSGPGSLRQTIADAQSGDTIVFDNSGENPPFPEGVETSIALSSIISFNKPLTIDGGATWTENGVLKTRVVLDGQSATSIMSNDYYQAGFVLQGLTFKNGAGATGLSLSSGLMFKSRETIIDHCVFDSCKSANGGAINASYTTYSSTISNCYFKNCEATTNGGAYYSYQTPSLTINNCTFDTCKAAAGGALYFNTATTKTLNNCVFINCEATVYGASIRNVASSVVNILNCTFGPTTSNENITNSGELIINDVLNVDKINAVNGSTVTFSGVDSVLAVTNDALIGSATFAAAEGSTGYAAFPTWSDTSAATFTGVKNCIYGAGLETFAIDFEGATWTADDLTVPILIEEKSGGTWTTLDAAATGGTYADTFAYGDSVRGFDGVQFLEASLDAYWKVKSWGVPSNGGGSSGDSDPSWVVDSSTITPNIEEL